MSAHIERTIEPKNADKSRTHLNRELLSFPDEVKNRTEAIQHRIDNAGITRKISHNQVRAIRIMLSGSPDEMKRIEETGKLDDWCKDNADWLKQTFGKDNLVSAVLHMDEKTPHIHATVVPIVTGERRKAKAGKHKDGKKQYKKKNINSARLCADDVMARTKLKAYQDSYAEVMSKYGLHRGIEGSEARHITTQQFYRELYVKNEQLQENIEGLEEAKQEVYEKVRDLYDRKDEAQDKFLSMDKLLQEKYKELATIETKLQTAKQAYEPYKAQDELNLIHELFPEMKEQLCIANLFRKIGFAIEHIRKLLKGIALTFKSGKLYSPEHKQYIETNDFKVKIEQEPSEPNKLRLNINGVEVTEWFRRQFNGLRQTNVAATKNRGIRM